MAEIETVVEYEIKMVQLSNMKHEKSRVAVVTTYLHCQISLAAHEKIDLDVHTARFVYYLLSLLSRTLFFNVDFVGSFANKSEV